MKKRLTITELKEERLELTTRQKKNLNIYKFISTAYGLNEFHHETRKKVLKNLSCTYKANFNKNIPLASIAEIYSAIDKHKKKSSKSASAYERTPQEITYWEEFEKITKKQFIYGVTMGDHVLDGLIPSYFFSSKSSGRFRYYGAVIEIDGLVHEFLEEKIKKDNEKEEILHQLGICLIRVSNRDVLHHSTRSQIVHIQKASLYSEAKKTMLKRIYLYTLASCASDDVFNSLFGVQKKILNTLNFENIASDSRKISAHDFSLPKIVETTPERTVYVEPAYSKEEIIDFVITDSSRRSLTDVAISLCPFE